MTWLLGSSLRSALAPLLPWSALETKERSLRVLGQMKTRLRAEAFVLARPDEVGLSRAVSPGRGSPSYDTVSGPGAGGSYSLRLPSCGDPLESRGLFNN